MNRPTASQGFALITVLLLLVVLMALVTAYFFLTGIETATTASSVNTTTGFYAAEAGLNIRGEEIRSTFSGYNRPEGKLLAKGAACDDPADYTPEPVTAGDQFFCKNVTLNGRTVKTYVVQDPKNLDPSDAERTIIIQPPEEFAGLNAIQYRYEVMADSVVPNDPDERPEAQLGMVFRSRLVPLFQFAAFYNKDLEINPGGDMDLNGRVHVNGDLYLNAGTKLDISGQVTVSESIDGIGGGLYRRRKDTNTSTSCTGTVRVSDAIDATNPNPALSCSAARVPQSPTLDGWNKQILTGYDTIVTPPVETFSVGGKGWDQADLRIALKVPASGTPTVIVADPLVPGGVVTNVTENTAMTTALRGCQSAAGVTKPYTPTTVPAAGVTNPVVEGSKSFRDMREGSALITMLEVDVKGLLTCMQAQRSALLNGGFGTTRDISETSEAGLVVFLTVVGPNSASPNSRYGVRVRNGDQLKSNTSTDPEIEGLTIISDQAAFIQGDYNRDDRTGDIWKPASFLVDTLNILSEGWDLANSDARSGAAMRNRYGVTTTINAALLAATTTTGNREGSTGQGIGTYNGGLENYPRLHEDWNGGGGAPPGTTTIGGVSTAYPPLPSPTPILFYKGSFVSLSRPLRTQSVWPGTGTVYDPPSRKFSYDIRFNNADNLPPLAPRFVYLRQERFARDFER